MEDKIYTLKEGDTLVDLAVKFKVGYQNLISANPEVDPWIPPAGKKILIPYKILIPEDFLLKKGLYLLINLPEMRLYYFTRKGFLVFPIGIGDEGKLPERGNYKIVQKKKRPFWYPPKSIRKEDPTLPEIVPPGPENPMGDYALYLDKNLYAIHGTNKVYSIGRRTTHGCFRLYPEDIKKLFNLVPLNIEVFVLYEPYKIALEGNSIYLQAFPDIENLIKNPFNYILRKIDSLAYAKGVDYQINLLILEKLLNAPDGRVHKIGKILQKP